MLRQGKSAGEMLMRGFTSGRDVGGNTFGLKRGIDEGHLVGPRIWPSGATISQTSGHGDFRLTHDLPRALGRTAAFHRTPGHARGVADGTDEVLRRVREQLMRGASHIKLMAGGGVASDYDPLDVSQYTEAEIRARGRSGGGLGHLRHRPRLYPAGDPEGDPRRRQVHRARQSGRRGNRQDDGRKRRLVEFAAVSR